MLLGLCLLEPCAVQLFRTAYRIEVVNEIADRTADRKNDPGGAVRVAVRSAGL